ncbi:MAG: GGDEF domain-containing protein [Burkholderiales bacterium]|jgi:diguanylate cyclase (GGDEF)-like protein
MQFTEPQPPVLQGADRARIVREVPRWQSRSRLSSGPAVLVVRIDQAADILKVHGPVAAEQLMMAITGALQRRLRSQDRLALVRDDEFLIVLPGVLPAVIRRIEQRLSDAVRGLRLSMAGRLWVLSSSIGVACAPEGRLPAPSVQELVRQADDDLHRMMAGEARRRA